MNRRIFSWKLVVSLTAILVASCQKQNYIHPTEDESLSRGKILHIAHTMGASEIIVALTDDEPMGTLWDHEDATGTQTDRCTIALKEERSDGLLVSFQWTRKSSGSESVVTNDDAFFPFDGVTRKRVLGSRNVLGFYRVSPQQNLGYGE